jgi:hypothetical protein
MLQSCKLHCPCQHVLLLLLLLLLGFGCYSGLYS